MNPFVQSASYVLDIIFSVFLFFVILRFLMQLMRGNFYNPISQASVKITNPLLKPLRVVIPGFFGVDLASVVLMLLVQLVFGQLMGLLWLHGVVNPLQLLIWGILGCLNVVVYITYIAGFIIMIASFVAPFTRNPFVEIARDLLYPLMAPIQRVIPPVGGLDFSLLVLFVAVKIFSIFLDYGAMGTGLFSMYPYGLPNSMFVIGYL